MKKYFFVAFQLFYGKKQVGYGGFVVVCSCCFERIVEALLDYYNEHGIHKADKVIITSLTILDKHTAAQLSNDFTDGALIIDDGENAEETVESVVDSWIARDMNGMLYLYVGNNQPKKKDTFWMTDDGDCAEMDSILFQEVRWSDEEPTKVKIVIDK